MWAESDGPGQGLDVLLHDRGAGRRAAAAAGGATSSACSPSCRASACWSSTTTRPTAACSRCRPPSGAWSPRDTESPARGAALARRAASAFDLAILDMHMPEMDGVALARRIRAQPRRRCRWCCSARSAGARPATPRRCSPPTWPSRCASRSCSTRWSACSRTTRAPKAAAAPAQAAARPGDGGAPSAAHPAGRGQRREPEARAAPAAADGLPRRPRVQRHRGGRVGASARPTMWC